MAKENGIDQLLNNAIETRVITEDKTEITVIKISFDYVLNDDGRLFTKVPKRIKKLMANCGGATVIKNLLTYKVGSSTMDVMKYYILLDADAVHFTKKHFNLSDKVYDFVMYHEIGHIVLGHISQEGYDCENEEFEIQADEFAFNRTGVKKTEKLVEALALVAFNSYRKKKLFGNWVNIYCVMNPSVVLNSIITYLKRRFGI